MPNSELWNKLTNAQLIQGQPPTQDEIDSPWFVKILLGFSGWLAAIFFLLFLAAAFSFVFDKPLASGILGLVLLAVAYVLLRQNKNDFLENLALVFCLAGQGLVFYAVVEVFDDTERFSMLAVLCIQIALFILIPHFIHRVFAAGSAAVTVLILASTFGLEYFASSLLLAAFVYLNFNEFGFTQQRKKISAAIYGIVFAILPFYLTLRFSLSREFYLNDINNPELFAKINYWAGEILLVLVLLYCVVHIQKRLNIALQSKISITSIIATLIFCYLGSHALGVTLSVVVLICGFANSNRVLQGIAIAALLFFTSQYYYSMNTTLLEKSQHLFILGSGLLLTRYLVSKFLSHQPTKKVTEHA